MRDMKNNIKVLCILDPVVATDATALVSDIVDTQGYGSLTLGYATGTAADADFAGTVLVEDGDNSALSDHAAVADAQLIGTEADIALTEDSDSVCNTIGYIGHKRYVRVTITPTDNTGNLPITMFAILGDPALAPVA